MALQNLGLWRARQGRRLARQGRRLALIVSVVVVVVFPDCHDSGACVERTQLRTLGKPAYKHATRHGNPRPSSAIADGGGGAALRGARKSLRVQHTNGRHDGVIGPLQGGRCPANAMSVACRGQQANPRGHQFRNQRVAPSAPSPATMPPSTRTSPAPEHSTQWAPPRLLASTGALYRGSIGATLHSERALLGAAAAAAPPRPPNAPESNLFKSAHWYAPPRAAPQPPLTRAGPPTARRCSRTRRTAGTARSSCRRRC